MAILENFLPLQPALQNTLQLKDYQQQIHGRQGISYFYSFITSSYPDNTLVIPDNCIDIIFECGNYHPAARICGTVSHYKPINLNTNRRYFGIRFMPGVMPNYIDLTPEDMPDHEYDFMDVIPGEEKMLEHITSCEDFLQQIDIYHNRLAEKPLRKTSEITKYIINEAILHNGNIKIGDLENNIGYSSRNIYRIFLNDTGVGLKLFTRFLRMQIAINLLSQEARHPLTRIAVELGFSDQSHFIRDFKALTGVSPRKMRTQFNPPNGSPLLSRVSALAQSDCPRYH
ncbi:AraC family transcriptional regulator [Pectobacterium cacticida]|uniref:AraC family transcriptional regulator n=1 Tax=Pectobacterium cacticida TaxID=69221 RepID=UPI0039866B3F